MDSKPNNVTDAGEQFDAQRSAMSAVIHIDFEAIHPVIDGEWHRTRLTGFPKSGQGITMLCGATASTVFRPLNHRRERGIPPQHTRQARR